MDTASFSVILALFMSGVAVVSFNTVREVVEFFREMRHGH